MSESKMTQYEEIFEIIRTWPPATRFTLVHDVLERHYDPTATEVSGRIMRMTRTGNRS